jgi:Fe-S-cluster containining protein
MLPFSGLREEETCYLLVVFEKRKHVTYQWSQRRGNMLPISGLGEEEACYIAVISEERKHVTYQWSLRREISPRRPLICSMFPLLGDH